MSAQRGQDPGWPYAVPKQVDPLRAWWRPGGCTSTAARDELDRAIAAAARALPSAVVSIVVSETETLPQLKRAMLRTRRRA